jgi:hypothetical protein
MAGLLAPLAAICLTMPNDFPLSTSLHSKGAEAVALILICPGRKTSRLARSGVGLLTHSSRSSVEWFNRLKPKAAHQVSTH